MVGGRDRGDKNKMKISKFEIFFKTNVNFFLRDGCKKI